MNKIAQFIKEFPEEVPPNLANIAVWLDNDIKIPPDEVLNIMKNVRDYVFVRVLEYFKTI